MAAYVFGVVLFALAILVSVSLHEAGHLLTAKAFKMKVSQYFVGFGPTIFSFRRGETEYGLKGIPLGGFCRIVGMTPHDEIAPEDEPRAMWRQPVWKRTAVMVSGSAAHFILAFVALWFTAIFMGLPNPALPEGMASQPAVVTAQPCVVVAPEARDCAAGDPTSPAVIGGISDGDRITAVNGVPVADWGDAVDAIQPLPPNEPATLTVDRGGEARQVTVTPAAVQRLGPDGGQVTVSALGVGLETTVPFQVTYGPLAAFGASAEFSGNAFVATFEAMKRLPEKIPALWASITGAERDIDTPISVVGASRLGGEAVQNDAWQIFVFLFISLNFFVGIFNLLPLLPLDGGHVAIAWFERARSWLYARIGRADPGRVNYYKLMPVTYFVLIVGGAFTLLTITADVVNPIRLFP